MSKDAEVTRIEEARGKDGSSAILVTGGQTGQGEVSYYMPKETFQALEKEGKQALREGLQRALETSLAGRDAR